MSSFLLLYGSQTGNAKAIANDVAAESISRGIGCRLVCMEDYKDDKEVKFANEKVVVIICSTCGEGDAPDNASRLWRRLKKNALPADHLTHLQYSILGLGDTNYSTYQAIPKGFQKRFGDLGAKCFYPPGYADDGTGLEVVIEPWTDGFYDAVTKALSESATTTDTPTNTVPMVLSNDSVLLLWGSETGNAKSIADDLVKEAADHGVKCRSSCMEDYKQDKEAKFETEKVLLVVVSTCDEGEAPDNVSRLWRRLRKKTLKNDHLSHLKFSILGLGDPNYSKNQAIPKGFHKRLTDLGAQSFYPSGYAHHDDDDSVVGPWKGGVWDAVKKVFAESNGSCASQSGADSGNDMGSKANATVVDGVAVDTSDTSSPELAEGLPPLADLKLPKLQPSFLQVDFENIAKADDANGSSKCLYQASTIVAHKQLTSEEAIKRTIDVTLTYEGDYVPGDTFCLTCPNNKEEIASLSKRLAIDDSVLGQKMQLKIDPKTAKKRAAVPEHLLFASTLAECLGVFCDIRASLPKSALRILAEYTSNANQRHYITYLCSRAGSEKYMQLMQEEGLCLIALLTTCPSCQPPYQRVLELLPALKPRRYSAASSPLADPNRVRFVLNVVDRGLCSTYMDAMGKLSLTSTAKGEKVTCAGLSARCALTSAHTEQPVPVVPLYREVKKIGAFNPPTDTSKPLIMIGPGTGIAPFLGFLQHRQFQRKANPDGVFGPTWLFFGNRHQQHDNLAGCEVQEYLKDGTLTHLYEAYSRDSEHKCKYVQDNFVDCGCDFVKAMVEDDGFLYVCGNSNGVVDDVGEHLTLMLIEHGKLTRPQALDAKVAWKESDRYVVEHFAG